MEESSLWKWGKLEFQGVSSVRFYLKDQVGKNYEVIFLFITSLNLSLHLLMTFVSTVTSKLNQSKADYRQLGNKCGK